MSTESNDLSFDPNQRRLCPDGACVGVIGEDGKCKVCGAADPDGPPTARLRVSALQDIVPEPVASPAPADGDAFDPNRRLCADDTCIGVLDAEGRCKVCGRVG
jgi:hypothetical protein